MPDTASSVAVAGPGSPRHSSAPTASAGSRVAIDITPSRDSHEVRHCENARHARSGLPRWPSETSRSEEHTSELQSLMRISYAVFCLKKKKIYINPTLT